MARKYIFALFTIAAFVVAGSMAALGQGQAALRGKILLKQADNSTVPVEGATIDLYRQDSEGKPLTTKTNKKGEFSYAGVLTTTEYAVVVSAPNAAPKFIIGVRGGNENIAITLESGDGKRLTEAEVREGLKPSGDTNASSGDKGQKQMSEAEAKKAEEEYKQKAAKNERIKQTTEVVNKALKDGNEAFNAKNYDVAIVKYDEGYTADPDYVGSAPVLLTNKAIALTNRGVDRYKAAGSDKAGKENAQKDFIAAYEAASKAYQLVKNPTTTVQSELATAQKYKYESLFRMTEALRLAVISGNSSKSSEIVPTFQEYINIETDPAKKAKAQLSMADLLRETGDCDKAAVEFKKILAEKPDDPDALAGAGLCLYNNGASKVELAKAESNKAEKERLEAEGKVELQEGMNALTRFVEVAPEGHKLKSSVADAIAYLKTEKIEAQKPAKAPAKKRGN